jgi:phosphate transport system substrate-binding protein
MKIINLKFNWLRVSVSVLALLILLSFASLLHAEETIKYHGSAPIGKLLMPLEADEYAKQEAIRLDINYETTTKGIKELLARNCDIAGGARPLTKEEKDNGLAEIPICADGFAFIVHKSNPLNQIASEQITNIFNGKITMWQNLGGAAGKQILIISPPLEAAYYSTARQLIGFDKLPANSLTVEETTDVCSAVKANPSSFGLASYADIRTKQNAKILKIIHKGKYAKVSPTHIRLNVYPYIDILYFYTVGEPKGKIKKFIDFLQSRKGKQVIIKSVFFVLPLKR